MAFKCPNCGAVLETPQINLASPFRCSLRNEQLQVPSWYARSLFCGSILASILVSLWFGFRGYGFLLAVRYRCDGRFFGRRVNCEYVPALPASIVRRVLDDPREIPYLLMWRREGTVGEAVRVARERGADGQWTGWIEIKRPNGWCTFARTTARPLPCGGSAWLLVCPRCQRPCRALYGWTPGGEYTSSAQTSTWQCRTCARLSYASEGGALVSRGRGAIARLFEQALGPVRSPRPEPWEPLVFASPAQAAAAGLCMLKWAER
jgi:hypothetical protein